jgi:hypothetical protein
MTHPRIFREEFTSKRQERMFSKSCPSSGRERLKAKTRVIVL